MSNPAKMVQDGPAKDRPESNLNDQELTTTPRWIQFLNWWPLPATICGVFLALAIILDEVGK